MRGLPKLCWVVGAMLFASPVAAQQSAPSDQQSSTAPAPPSGAQSTPEAPPPFPPMPARAPRHRFVDMGTSHHSHTSRARHMSSSHHHAAATGRHASSRHHATETRHASPRNEEQAIREAAKTLRWCEGLSHRQLRRHSGCNTLLRGHGQADEGTRSSRHHHRATHDEATRHDRSRHHHEAKRHGKTHEDRDARHTTRHHHVVKHRHTH